MGDRPTRVLIVDDHRLFRDGLAALIARWDEFELVGSAADGEEGAELARRLGPDLVLMDVRMPGMDGIEATRRITAAGDQPRILMLTTFDLEDHSLSPTTNAPSDARHIASDGVLLMA